MNWVWLMLGAIGGFILFVAIKASVNNVKKQRKIRMYGEHHGETHEQKRERHIREKRDKKRAIRSAWQARR